MPRTRKRLPAKYERLISGQHRSPAKAYRHLKSEALSIQTAFLRAATLHNGDPHLHHLTFPKTPEFRPLLTTPFTHSLRAELQWAILALPDHIAHLNTAYAEQRRIDAAIIHGFYPTATEHLSTFERDHGISLWSMQRNLLIATLSKRLPGNRECLKALHRTVPDALSRALTTFYAARCEDQVSAENFENLVVRGLQPDATSPLTHGDRYWLRARFLALLPSSTPVEVAYYLWRESSFPLIDRLAAIAKALTWVCLHDHDTLQRIAPALKLLRGLRHPLIMRAHRIVMPDAALQPGEVLRELLTALDKYVVGDYESAQHACVDALPMYPDEGELFEVAALSAALGRRAPAAPFDTNSLGARVMTAYERLLARPLPAEPPKRDLQKLALLLEPSPLAAAMAGVAEHHDHLLSTISVTDSERCCRLVASTLTPRFSDFLSSASNRERVLTVFPRAGHTACAAVMADRTEGVEMPPLSNDRAVRYEARRLVRVRAFEDAARAFAQLYALQEDVFPAALLATRGQIFCAQSTHRVRDAVAIYVARRLRHPAIALFVAASAVAPVATAQRECAHDDIARVVFLHMAFRDGTPGVTAQQVFFALEDLLLAHKCRRPSELVARLGDLPQEALVYLLNEVCSPEILDYSIDFASSAQLEAEQIRLLQELIELASDRAAQFADRIRALTRSSMLRSAFKYLQESKVFVDTESIERSLDGSLRQRIDRYLSYTMLQDRDLKENINIQRFAKSGVELRLVSDHAFDQFCAIFDDIKSRFISSNEFGLDSYLSVRIRHGTLAGEIRAVFERQHLVTQRDDSGRYAPNAHWRRIAGTLSPQDMEKLDHLLAEFSGAVDATIATTRNEWLQIASDALPQGLFDYRFAEADLFELYTCGLLSVRSAADLVAYFFDELWSRTRTQLGTIRERFTGELVEQFQAHLETLSQGLVTHGLSSPAISTSIGHARTDIQTELAKIAGWFSPPKATDLASFSIDWSLETAIEMLARSVPGFRPTVTRCIDPGAQSIKGSLFVPFADALYILLENAAKHSGRMDTTIRITVTSTEAELQIVVINTLSDVVDCEALAAQVGRLNEAQTRRTSQVIRREGGSGYAKLHKILRYDLGCGDDYSVAAAVTETSREFVARVSVLSSAVYAVGEE